MAKCSGPSISSAAPCARSTPWRKGRYPSPRRRARWHTSYSCDLCVRAIRTHHRLRDGPTLRGTDLNGDPGAVAAAPADESHPDALLPEGSASDAEGPTRGRERYLQPGSCNCRAAAQSAVSQSGVSPPTFSTVTFRPFERHAGDPFPDQSSVRFAPFAASLGGHVVRAGHWRREIPAPASLLGLWRHWHRLRACRPRIHLRLRCTVRRLDGPPNPVPRLLSCGGFPLWHHMLYSCRRADDGWARWQHRGA
jgi:hypothetical protein